MEYRNTLEDIETMEMNTAKHTNTITPDRSAESGILQERIGHALRKLTDRERSVFVLRHYHDLPLKDIAETLKIAEGSVKAYLFRALKRLQQELVYYRTDLGIEEQEL